MYKPTVSIVISTYNDERYIAKALKSVLQQTFNDWETIIINDASTDKTEKIIKDIFKNNPKLVYIKNKINVGVTPNLNKGIKKSKGKYIARLDGDDIWSDKNKLKKQVEFLEKNPDYVLVGSWAKAIDEKEKQLYSLKYASSDKDIRRQMLINNCFLHSSVVMVKEDVERVGYYNSTNQTSQDYELWLELAKRKKVYNIPQYLIMYRINPKGISVTKNKKQIDETIKIINKNKNAYPHYNEAIVLWNIRKYYPEWLRGEMSIKLKNLFNKYV